MLQFSLNVEQDVGFALGHSLVVGGQHGRVVEVEPMVVLDHKGSVVAGSGTKNKNKKDAIFTH